MVEETAPETTAEPPATGNVPAAEISSAQKTTAAENTIAAGSNFIVKERFEILFDTPLPHLDSNGAKAYAAKDKINPKRDLFALICSNDYPPRLSLLPYLKSIDHPNILKLVEFGIVDYPAGSSRNMALIYRQPAGPRVTEFNEEDSLVRTNFERFKSLLLSMISACESLKGYNLTHRSIRLDNLWYRDNTKTEIVLGDCLATFPAYLQPAGYETIESLLCVPEGRGNGSNSDDIYAVGVAMLGLIQQADPLSGLSAPEVLHQKIKKGSYLTLAGNSKIHNLYTVVLKAMLNDNKEARWNYLQIFNHLEGKANSFSNAEISERSMRALTVSNEKYYTPKTAAIALLNNPEEGIALLRSGKLQEWVKTGLENEKLSLRIDKLFHQESSSPQSPEAAIGEICILLDYTLPLKVGSVYVFPDGLSKTIFSYLRNNQNLGDFYNLLSTNLLREWYQEQPNMRSPANAAESRIFINRRDYGFGIERIMYDFDEDLPCTSTLLDKEFVNSPSQVLRALDSNYSKFKDKAPYDRNLIAYLRSKMGKKIDGIITDLNSPSDYMKSSAVIRLFANIQAKHGPVQLFNLTTWLVSITKPLINNFHNLKYRRYLEQEMGKVAKNGKIIEVYDLLENSEAKLKDRTDYSAALKEISILNNERNRILTGGPKLDEESRELALRLASLLAILVMVVSFGFNLFYWIIK